MGDLWISKYKLQTAGALNAQTDRSVYEGVLVREGAGFGCLHSWPELGDPTLEECLVDLAGERGLALVRRTMACVEADGIAREAGKSLFEGLEVPRSHATLPVLNPEILGEAVSRGFDQVKVKAGRDVGGELREVRRMMKEFPGLGWRIDFNERGTLKELLDEFENWSEEEKGGINFLEDPVSYWGGDWAMLGAETGMVLANDRHVEEDRGDSEVLIVKPAVNGMLNGERVVVTSYMDHPLGQAFAAWEAARAGVTEVCGLQTHGLFAANGFTEALGRVRPGFGVPEGAGLGFGDLLEGLPWSRLAR